MIDHTHDAAASSWVEGADDHADFPVQNLPLGVFSLASGTRHIGSAIGNYTVDLAGLADAGLLPDALRPALCAQTLNALFRLDGATRRTLRHALFALLTDPAQRAAVSPWLHPMDQVDLHLPFAIGDYSDFYVGIHHATNIGKLFRPDSPLLPNYKHVPIGYHGRASSVRVSGTPVIRPKGQIKAPDADQPTYAPCRRLDYELELGIWIAGDHALGETIPITDAWDRIAGFSLLNDWSARDIQAWEYQPLGPFLSKSFHSTISPWVITAEALAPFRVAQPARAQGDPSPLPYLWDQADQARGALSITLSATLASAAMRESGMTALELSRGTARAAMYWTPAQIVTHQAANGCDLHSGDLLGTGTLSGPTRGSEGSLMEMSQGGKHPIRLPTGQERCFLEDGDELILYARAERDGYRSIGFGPCSGIVTPSRS
ncbi:fumarylacetoacetase [Novosphingobium sp. KACC 22771]|uniref:fumarylacetoacetase n=1 Tax=Novosphingobium sp. KACC 22771 TaxID=3025670 RepID=UPI0023665E94|nr:fumarylacetoacetase [Novosphingobium sp. KACC 22771]WDF75089.1 fumarylacetoacetase [Novosphingobium sp. KACC 22771]